MSSRHSRHSSPRRKSLETDHPARRFEPLTRDLINEDMMQYQDRYTTTNIRDKGVTFSIKSDYKQPDIVDLETESTTSKFGNFRAHEAVTQHSEKRRRRYWDRVMRNPDHVLKHIRAPEVFSTKRGEKYIGPSLNYYNGNWVVDGFSQSNNKRFVLIRASREGEDAPKRIFLYDLNVDLLIGVRQFGANTTHDNIEGGLQNVPELFGVPRRGGKKNIKKRTKRIKRTNRKTRKH
jgi:hypothetical protein